MLVEARKLANPRSPCPELELGRLLGLDLGLPEPSELLLDPGREFPLSALDRGLFWSKNVELFLLSAGDDGI